MVAAATPSSSLILLFSSLNPNPNPVATRAFLIRSAELQVQWKQPQHAIMKWSMVIVSCSLKLAHVHVLGSKTQLPIFHDVRGIRSVFSLGFVFGWTPPPLWVTVEINLFICLSLFFCFLGLFICIFPVDGVHVRNWQQEPNSCDRHSLCS